MIHQSLEIICAAGQVYARTGWDTSTAKANRTIAAMSFRLAEAEGRVEELAAALEKILYFAHRARSATGDAAFGWIMKLVEETMEEAKK